MTDYEKEQERLLLQWAEEDRRAGKFAKLQSDDEQALALIRASKEAK